MSDTFRTPPPTTSLELARATLVTGRAEPLDEQVLAYEGGSTRPALVRRRFRFQGEDGMDLQIEGFTTYPPPFCRADPLRPSLFLDGQRFFDDATPEGAFPLLLVLGGGPTALVGSPGRRALAVGGPEPGGQAVRPVRPFRLAGADLALPKALATLVGLAGGLGPETVEKALAAGHLLPALDALRIACTQDGDPALALRLAEPLLHPAQGSELKTLALVQVAHCLRRLKPGSDLADALVELSLWSWRLERQYPLHEAYVQAWRAAPDQVGRSPVARELAAMALDETAAERLKQLQHLLREAL